MAAQPAAAPFGLPAPMMMPHLASGAAGPSGANATMDQFAAMMQPGYQPPARAPAAAPAAAPAPAGAPAGARRRPSGAAAPAVAPGGGGNAAVDDGDGESDPEYELEEEHDDGDVPQEDAVGWKRDDNYPLSQRVKTLEGEAVYSPRLMFGYEGKGIFEFATEMLPMEFIKELAAEMDAIGKAKHVDGISDYQNWAVTRDDVLQWIGVWLYRLAYPTQGGVEAYFNPPTGGFGPTHNLAQWLKIGCPSKDRGIFWFKQMQACFRLPTNNTPADPFDKTRRFWDALRDAFKKAVTAGWVICVDESMVKWLGRNMPGFMHVQRKPTPKGLELHTVCCGISGVMVWFEVYEGKEAMTKKEYCAEMKAKLKDGLEGRAVEERRAHRPDHAAVARDGESDCRG